MPFQAKSQLASALREATVSDIEFEEVPFRVHEGDSSSKVGCRPVSVRGVAVPRPALVVYVRAEDARGRFWYVVDWAKPGGDRSNEEVLVESEELAREAVLERLLAAAERGLL